MAESITYLTSSIQCLTNLKEIEVHIGGNEIHDSNLTAFLDSLEKRQLIKFHFSVRFVGEHAQEDIGIDLLRRFEALDISDKKLF